MAEGNFSADGSSDWFAMPTEGSAISVNGTFGGGTVTLEQVIKGVTYPVKSDATDITMTADDSAYYDIGGMTVRLTLAGATAPNINWEISSPRIRKL
jgi:hypothetical protein